MRSIDNYVLFNDVDYNEAKVSWNEFNKCIKGKSLVLVGGGEVCDEFIKKYSKKYDVIAIVDSNSKKLGENLRGITIIGMDDLKNITKDFLILITSTKYNKELKDKFYKIYGDKVFSLLDMELLSVRYRRLKWLYKFKYNIFSEYGVFRNYFVFNIFGVFRRFHLPRFYGENEKRIYALKNGNKNKRCFIVAPGPSLDINDLEKLKNEITFGVNAVFRAFEKTSYKPNYYALLDVLTIPKYEKENDDYNLNSCAKDKIFISDSLRKYAKKYDMSKIISIPVCNIDNFINFSSKLKYSDDLVYGHFAAYTVTVFAINIAEYMGFKEIYLFGVDCNYSGNKQYFDGSKNVEANNYNKAKKMQDNQMKAYEMIKHVFDKKGIKIYNATRGGSLEVFERIDFDTLF